MHLAPSMPSSLVCFMLYLGAGGSHSSTGHLDVKTALWILFASQTGVIRRLSCSFPVTDSLSNCLENTLKKKKKIPQLVLHLLQAESKRDYLIHFAVPNEDILLLAHRLA